jgi:hypothetical protein
MIDMMRGTIELGHEPILIGQRSQLVGQVVPFHRLEKKYNLCLSCAQVVPVQEPSCAKTPDRNVTTRRAQNGLELVLIQRIEWDGSAQSDEQAELGPV